MMETQVLRDASFIGIVSYFQSSDNISNGRSFKMHPSRVRIVNDK